MHSRALPRLRAFALLSLCILTLLASGCASRSAGDKPPSDVRAELTRLQNDPQLAGLAPKAMQEAEEAVAEADKPQTDSSLAKRLNFIAGSKVARARAAAETELQARKESRAAKNVDDTAAEATQRQAAPVLVDDDPRLARMQQQIDELSAKLLQSRLMDLSARPTDRGQLVILDDGLFAPGQAQLKNPTPERLVRIARFLVEYDDRTVVIEGHTDNVGTETGNQELAQARADAVKNYLISEGIKASRIRALGLGEGSPIADNGTAAGRQSNRRVELLIVAPGQQD